MADISKLAGKCWNALGIDMTLGHHLVPASGDSLAVPSFHLEYIRFTSDWATVLSCFTVWRMKENISKENFFISGTAISIGENMVLAEEG